MNTKKCFLLICINICQVCFGQATSSIYGIARKTTPSSLFLANINSTTGTITNISSVSLGSGFINNGCDIDPINQIFFYQDASSKFMSIDLVTGNVVSSPTMTNINADNFDFFEYNCVDSTIYGIARKNSPTELFLAKINPTTGVVTNISQTSIGSGFINIGCAIDPINNKFFYKDISSKFMSIDLVSGNIISNPLITNPNADHFDFFAYNYIDSTIYGIARKNSPAELFLAKIDPSTGIVTNISSNSIGTSFINNGCTIDPVNKIFYYQDIAAKFMSIDMVTGNLISNPSMTNINANFFDFFEYSNNSYCSHPNFINNSSVTNHSMLQYPNPLTEQLTVEYELTDDFSTAEIIIYSAIGVEIKRLTVDNNINKITIDVAEIESGNYFYEFRTPDGFRTFKKIIIQR
jgi:hypothetical protein